MIKSKYWFLGLIVLLPIILVGILHFFGKNTYSLKPPYYPNGLDGQSAQHYLPKFSFTSQSGQVFNSDSIKGKVVISDFIFTTCQTICPVMTSQMTRVQEAFKNDPNVLILSHSIDPEGDSVPVLKDYAKRFGVIDSKWKLLTGKPDDIFFMAHKGYAVSAGADNTDPQGFVHSDKMVLVDKEGRIRGYYSGVDPLKVDTLILETKILLEEYK